MNWLDRALQRWRVRKAARHIPPGARVLDIGCFDGSLFRLLSDRIGAGVGIDPLAEDREWEGRFRLVRGSFPADLPDGEPYDAIAALAVVEHLRPEEGPRFAHACRRALADDGRLILTIPAAAVDALLRVMQKLHLLHGMSVEEHHGFAAAEAERLFTSHGFVLDTRRRFQLGLNCLLVFRKAEQES